MSKKMLKRSLAKKIMMSVFASMILFGNGVVCASQQMIGDGTWARSNSVALGDYASADAWSSVALGYGSQTNLENVVSVGHGGVSGLYSTITDSSGGTLYVPNTRSIINVTDIVDRLETDSTGGYKYGSYAVNVNTLNAAIYQEALYREQSADYLKSLIIDEANARQDAIAEEWRRTDAAIAAEGQRRDEAIAAETRRTDAAILAEAQRTDAAIAQEVRDRDAAIAAEGQRTDAAIAQEVRDRDAAIAAEGQRRDEAIMAEANRTNQAINGINQRLDRTNAKLNKVGAGAAALAALHPLEYDPEDKLTFSAGMGNYAGENAAALGAFYRPNEKFMVSLGGTMGNGENMVNLGLSIGLDKPNGYAKLSKRELIQEVNAVKAENEAMKDQLANADERIAKLEALVAQLVAK